jgi:N-acetylglucosamine kinase-like BadF-type ATPase
MNGTPGLLGVDGGGTSTIAWLADIQGNVLGRGAAGPSNAKAVGAEAARAALDEAILRAFTDAHLELDTVEVACLGLAGFDRPEDKRLLEEWSNATRRARRLVLVNDGELVLAAGTPEGVGVAVISGTGSIAVGKSPEGQTARAGGWGHLFGDEGSAYDVALAGLRMAAKRCDGRDALKVLKAKSSTSNGAVSRGGALTERLCQAIGVSTAEQFVTAIYSGDFDRARLASLAPTVVASAEEDPEVLGWILEPAGYELGQAALAVARALKWNRAELPLAMAGGFLLSADPVREAMLAYLKRFSGFAILPRPVPHPVEGALVLARGALRP